ncbi:MAG TPA: hypothetical protein DDW50_19385 [Firmicutes bacterium]|jgi:hypothetical protein|nr:hypothetical protein [Bacillota bacterium]
MAILFVHGFHRPSDIFFIASHQSYFLKAAVADMVSLKNLVDQFGPFGTINTSVVLCSPVSYRTMVPENEIVAGNSS